MSTAPHAVGCLRRNWLSQANLCEAEFGESSVAPTAVVRFYALTVTRGADCVSLSEAYSMRKTCWKVSPDAGALAYLFDLIENLGNGAWRENCREYEGRPRA